MSAFKSGTILKRRDPFVAPDHESPDPDLTPYNDIEVIGQSPVQENVRSEEWVGQGGDRISVKPTTFGAVIDRPQGELERDYEVVSIPPPPTRDRQIIETLEPGPSPEEQFAAIAAAGGEAPTSSRKPTPIGDTAAAFAEAIDPKGQLPRGEVPGGPLDPDAD